MLACEFTVSPHETDAIIRTLRATLRATNMSLFAARRKRDFLPELFMKYNTAIYWSQLYKAGQGCVALIDVARFGEREKSFR